MEKMHTLGTHALIELAQTSTFLCMQRSAYKDKNANQRDLPGGGCELGEQVIDCLWRELAEEISITPTTAEQASTRILGTWSDRSFSEPSKWGTVIYYHLILETDRIQLSSEHTAYRWLSLEEIQKLTPQRSIIQPAIDLYTTFLLS